jgi:hypothetical protein
MVGAAGRLRPDGADPGSCPPARGGAIAAPASNPCGRAVEFPAHFRTIRTMMVRTFG